MTAKTLKQSSRTPERETRTVLIHGMPCTLEKRKCQGGCDKEFWVMPSSTAEHARSDCKFVCGVPIDQIPEDIMRRYDQYFNANTTSNRDFDSEKKDYTRQLFSKTSVRTKPAKPEKPKPLPKEEDPIHIKQMRRWNTAITRARRIMEKKEHMPRFRESVASIARAVVTNKKNFSIKCFSLMVGLDRKTLQSWINVKSEIVDKISVYDGNFLAARKTREYLKRNPDESLDIEMIYIQESQRCRKQKVKEDAIKKTEPLPGLSTIVPCGKTRIYRMKIKVKYVS